MFNTQMKIRNNFSINVACESEEQAHAEARRLIEMFKTWYYVLEWEFEVEKEAKNIFRVDFQITFKKQVTYP
jgi:hypothetical protein